MKVLSFWKNLLPFAVEESPLHIVDGFFEGVSLTERHCYRVQPSPPLPH
jgi:hypothetical protein